MITKGATENRNGNRQLSRIRSERRENNRKKTLLYTDLISKYSLEVTLDGDCATLAHAHFFPFFIFLLEIISFFFSTFGGSFCVVLFYSRYA